VLSTYVAVIFKSDTANEQLRQQINNIAVDEGDISLVRQEAEYDEDPEIVDEPENLLSQLVESDRSNRHNYLKARFDLLARRAASPRVLFVVPTEPLVWQVAAFFTKLLRVEGDLKTKVAMITDQLTYNPSRVFAVQPPIVVGTPKALESALTKARGLNGEFESSGRVAGDLLAGGFDNFDWVVYDEVHSLDGEEGAALQRLIRSMQCPFLALSATVGNADRLKDWFESVRQDQLGSIQSVTVPTVECLNHQTRFINLQRYIWNQTAAVNAHQEGKLQTVNPLAAVPDAQSLVNGLLTKSSLSFTPKDCVRVWDAMQLYFAPEMIQEYDFHRFFAENERITLARAKEYEDLLKKSLVDLAHNHPTETDALLKSFHLEETPREFDLCEMMFELKSKDMIPALPFHLNTFEAVKLFQQLLGRLEWMQHATFPTYYTDKIKENKAKNSQIQSTVKSFGGNAKDQQAAAQSGQLNAVVTEVDIYEPHPNFILGKSIPMTADEFKKLISEMERYDGFKARDREAMEKNPGLNLEIVEHPLIRGLKRGVGLFLDVVSFPSYRRAVQKLASEGKLGVVISDSALAFGVNMPFRTCIFCGEMNGKLDELMAQQMSGRAGRRGLDTQGNIIYAGIRPKLIQSLMIGKVCDITGRYASPHYDTLILQPILSSRHVGYHRANVIGGKSLFDFLQDTIEEEHHEITTESSSSAATITATASAVTTVTAGNGEQVFDGSVSVRNVAVSTDLQRSKKVMIDLGFIVPTRTRFNQYQYVPNIMRNYNFTNLTIMWEMRKFPYESITVGMFFDCIVREFYPIVRDFPINDRRFKLDVMEPHIHGFFVILLTLVCRTEWRHRDEFSRQPEKLSELVYFSVDSRRELLQRYQKFFAIQQGSFEHDRRDPSINWEIPVIPDQYAYLRDPVSPEKELDGTLLQCCLDPAFVHKLDDLHKQEIKEQIWRLGNILKLMNDYAKTEEKYVRVAYFLFLNAFKKMKYLLSELVVLVIDFSDCAAYASEKRHVVSKHHDVLTMWDSMNMTQICEELCKCSLYLYYCACISYRMMMMMMMICLQI
jgi:hypothetical protein